MAHLHYPTSSTSSSFPTSTPSQSQGPIRKSSINIRINNNVRLNHGQWNLIGGGNVSFEFVRHNIGNNQWAASLVYKGVMIPKCFDRFFVNDCFYGHERVEFDTEWTDVTRNNDWFAVSVEIGLFILPNAVFWVHRPSKPVIGTLHLLASIEDINERSLFSSIDPKQPLPLDRDLLIDDVVRSLGSAFIMV